MENQGENVEQPNVASEEPVCVSIEPNHECELYEIKYDGQLVFKEFAISFFFCFKPWSNVSRVLFFIFFLRILSHSQHLAQMIGKLKLNDDKKASDDEDSDEAEVDVASESQKQKMEHLNQVNKSQALSARKFFQNVYEKAK